MEQLILAIYAVTSSLALVFLKLGSKTGAPVSYISHKLSFNLSPFVISGIILYGVSFIVYTYLISKYDLGYIIPIATALVYILIFVASFFIFKESFTIVKILGIGLILIGAVLLNLNK